MSTAYVTLRPFAENELIFDETETKDILKFFFLHLRERIDTVSMTTELRNFAQGLLVEAIDATYALGYLEILFRASYNPGSGMSKALSKIGRKGARLWFKHGTQADLLRTKISSRVRDQLAHSFASIFPMMLEGIARARGARAKPGGTRSLRSSVRFGHSLGVT
ncbi:MAG: hypothetical protein AB7S62_17810 [Azoarcus sp.]